MTKRYYYATHNTRASLFSGNHGFLNTWEVSRFSCIADRNAFVEEYSNKLARAVTRKEATHIFNGCYLSVGETVPAGGLFGNNRNSWSNFWNENNIETCEH